MKKLALYEQYMKLIGPIGNLMFYFQAYEIFSSHSAKIISFPGFFLSFIGLSSWLLYGVLIKNTPLIIANAVGVIGTILVLTGRVIYT